ncbi:hypothetical protein GCM10009639_29420 [Kitasatospora putterlickiae]|uniref:Uncharacterized protein n=1 Tax=Kitasatospora putterlickiae TaxID=221725 RepID=A0ABN1Y0X2_9ACTN
MTIQTFPGVMGEPVALRAALMLYPARYRRERGDELSAVFADSTAGTSRLATAREVLDLGAYGLRMRTGLTASSVVGQLFALAAPLVAGAVAGLCAAYTVDQVVNPAWVPAWTPPDRIGEVPAFVWFLGQALLPLLLVAAVLAGRRREARYAAFGVAGVGALGVLTAAVQHTPSLWWFLARSGESTPLLLAGLLFAFAPQELMEERPDARGRIAVLAAAAGGALILTAEGFYSSFGLLDRDAAVALLLVPAAALLFAARGRLAPAAIGLAALPMTLGFNVFRTWQSVGGMWRMAPLTVAVVVGLVATGWMLRRAGDGRRTGAGAGGVRSLV